MKSRHLIASTMICGAFGVALPVVSVSAPAFAAPIAYDESVGGDLPAQGFPLPTFTLDVGANTVTGTTAYIATSTSDLDSFAFTVPAGMQVIAGGVVVTEPDPDLTTAGWQVASGSANFIGGTFVEQLNTGVPGADALTVLPLGPGVYNMSGTSLGGFSDTFPASANYTFTLTVAAVPEPASVGLLALGAGATLLRRRRV